jgi:four helix bundle protein
MQDFRNLSVWQRARRLTKSVYEMTTEYPGSEEFGLKSQMRRAAVSICSNIAEGCGRRGDREFRRFLDVAMGSACELECETILSFDLAFITEALQEEILGTLIQIKRMLGGLLSRLGWGRLPDMAQRDRPVDSTARRGETDS